MHQPPVARGFRLLFILCIFHLAAAPALARDLVGVYLTWSDDPATTMTINWVDLFPEGGNTVWYRVKDADEWKTLKATQSAVGETTMQRRHVQLTGLEPDTVYDFAVATQPVKSTDGWRFRTMPAKLDRPIRFVTGGDMMHTRERVDAMNKQAARLDPDFALLGGDLAYANGVSSVRWIDWFQSWTKLCIGKDRRLIPMVLCIGNHEVRSKAPSNKPADRAPFFYSLFTLPGDRSYYALDFGDYLSLVILDSEHTQPIAGAQTQWLEQAMASRANQEFLFACYHYPAYGTTKAPKDKLPIDAPKSIAIRRHWMPILEKYGLSAVFENDHHNFKRTHRIRNHQRDDDNGLLYLGDGSWGVSPRTVPKEGQAWWLAKALAVNHLWAVDLDPKGTATLYAIDAKGVKFDEVKLDKPRTTPVPAE